MCLWLNSSRNRIFSFRLFTNKLHLFQHITEIILSCLKLIFQALLVTTTAEGSKGVHSELNQRTEELWEINGGNFFSCIQIVNDKSCFMKQLLKVKVEINNFTLYWSLIVSATGFAEGEEWKWWIKGVKSFQGERDLPLYLISKVTSESKSDESKESSPFKVSKTFHASAHKAISNLAISPHPDQYQTAKMAKNC